MVGSAAVHVSPGSHRTVRPWGTQKRCLPTGRGAACRSSTVTKAVPSYHTAGESLGTSRRAFLAQAALVLPAVVAPGWAAADEETVAGWSTFSDDTERFSVAVPPGWSYGEAGIPGNTSFSGASGTRRVIAWFPDPSRVRENSVTLVITNVGADFTAMGSFGTAYTFGANLVGSMDQSYLKRAPAWARPKGPIQEAELLDARDVSGSYVVEYTVYKEPEPKRHLLSRVALGYNGTYNRLYTLTAQTTEQEWPALKASVEKMLKSFAPPKSAYTF